jgi:proline iminopeptidase
MTFARLCAHYFSRAAWLEPDELLRNCGGSPAFPEMTEHVRAELDRFAGS